MDTTISSEKPYMLRAMYEWLSDNNLTPHITVNVNHPDIIVPLGHDEHGVLMLNISMNATKDLLLLD